MNGLRNKGSLHADTIRSIMQGIRFQRKILQYKALTDRKQKPSGRMVPDRKPRKKGFILILPHPDGRSHRLFKQPCHTVFDTLEEVCPAPARPLLFVDRLRVLSILPALTAL